MKREEGRGIKKGKVEVTVIKRIGMVGKGRVKGWKEKVITTTVKIIEKGERSRGNKIRKK